MAAGLQLHADWLVPQWPVPANVHAVCTSRTGGVSSAPYDSLNLGQHVGDFSEHVECNRSILDHAIGAHAIYLSQVHGNRVVTLSEHTAQGTQADACMTDQAGLACTIMVADCLPLLFANQQGNAVAAAHAGWRGLAGAKGHGIVETVLAHFGAMDAARNGSSAAKITVWMGPCIGPEAFEVGDDVRDVFVSADRTAQAMFRSIGNGKWLANLPGLTRLRLNAAGVSQIYGNDGGSQWCTVNNPSRFFSHRRDRVSGRMAACVWLG